jgi:hypothetical protein
MVSSQDLKEGDSCIPLERLRINHENLKYSTVLQKFETYISRIQKYTELLLHQSDRII